jgi:F0F1-type ATP synthase membrane subunit a
MNDAVRRGLIVFGGLVVFLVICAALTFSVMPGTGSGVALPVIMVPGEPYKIGWPSDDFPWTNTLTAMVLADIFVLAFIYFAWRGSNGWTKEVPGRFQAWAELIGEFIYGQTKNFAGERPLARNWLFPLAASIFVFLLAINWMKLLPGIESVGVMHCAGEVAPELGINVTLGYPKVGDRLWVNQSLNGGFDATPETYHTCEEWKEGHFAKPTKDQLEAAAVALEAEEAALMEEMADAPAEELTAAIAALRMEATESVYEHPTIALSASELRTGVEPYLFVVTPYVRGGSTDLNLTIGLALIAFISFQVFGVAAQGPAYFFKFINIPALGNIQKKPLGAVDFLVGVFEIVSEIGKIVSLSFRLFGNLFAGGILLMVMAFLVAFILPVIFYGLEIIVTTIQAYVFAILTIVFSAQAMEGHHGDDHDEHHDEHAAEASH